MFEEGHDPSGNSRLPDRTSHTDDIWPFRYDDQTSEKCEDREEDFLHTHVLLNIYIFHEKSILDYFSGGNNALTAGEKNIE